MTLALQAMPLTCLLLLLLHNAPGLSAQPYPDFKLEQPRGPVVVTKGEVLTLNCTAVGSGPIGPTKWLKGQGSSSQTIYDPKGSFPRVTRVDTESSKDFSIRIRDVRLEDTGTYYCVKFQRGTFGEEFFRSGGGTEVLVHARPSELAMSEPSDRAVPGQSVPFTCSTGGFFPRDIQVKWLKNSTPVRAEPPRITAELPGTYSVSSTVQVNLSKADVRSELSCEVQHSTLAAPLTRTFALGRVLRVAPRVSVVAAPPGAVEVNETVNFTCRVRGFYPGAVSISWMENGTERNVGSSARPTETSRGLFELNSTLTVQAGEEKSGSRFTCRVVHEDQEPISSTAILWVAAPTPWEPRGATFLSSPGLWLGLLLYKALLGLGLFFLFKRVLH
ncbi:tyrosine-protein phosphatase non-receptor type substrate 1-like isoform X2 [Excalfactoria chinensis]|uniref:tyrosine-protein phosphatase non-receptor type substrate 1-like isoform X2 n=1 Tax=Excalfactoria chinensis TaxID=46218 RepID=UPI003B3AE293